MSRPLAPVTYVYLLLPAFLWASNAIIGRLSVAGGHPIASPLVLNALRWVLTLVVLGIVAAFTARRWRRHPHAPGVPHPGLRVAQLNATAWRKYAMYGLLAVAAFNALQYTALRTSTAINVTLIAASGPLFVLVIGRLFFDARARSWAWIGAGVSLVGVLVVLTGGDFARVAELRLVKGDLLMIAAAIVWAVYSWLLRRGRPQVPALTHFILQTAWGVVLCTPFVAVEWLVGDLALQFETRSFAILLWLAIGPSLIAYWCWDRGVAQAGPLLPAFAVNLTPLIAALMSTAMLGEFPQVYHAIAFLLIAGGMLLSQRGAGGP